MPDMLTVSTEGQLSLPVDLRAEYGIGYVVRRPPKNLLDYAGFIKADQIDPEAESAAVEDAAVARYLGENEC